ncbi:UPF0587 protein [Cinnamomum micranthum f. kanehirae]|uniref:UPF0587 protein n=1 Tax=Cinnamomum micranthum f. kanehirae TaxID=337451 RepID=A0A443N234_9MAGN|nr:UPF0587 protein [Cinnamomum micranthum f. kanehirae]
MVEYRLEAVQQLLQVCGGGGLVVVGPPQEVSTPCSSSTQTPSQIECESCGSISEEEVRLCQKEEFLVPDPIWSGGETTNLVYECNVCGKTGTILMVSGKGHPLPSLFGETGSYTTIMVFNCDGVKPTETGQKIPDIYISDGEFADLHEHDNNIVPVAIWKADAKFVKSE